jgi:uncharacterized protein YutE (UPF0331/DUF86 family)
MKKDWDMDTDPILTRLHKLDDYLTKLRARVSLSNVEYLADSDQQDIVERNLQLAIHACIDVANYIIAYEGLRSADKLENVFAVLAEADIIPMDLASRMVGMVRFRNILVHNYLDIDSSLVYEHLTHRLDDFEAFARAILKFVEKA